MTLTLYDADRCPYCARARIYLQEKGVEHETVAIDLSDRPAWLYEKNPLGKVPVIEEDTFVLPESAVIMEYLEERYPEPALLPADPAERALSRLLVWQHDIRFADDYYAARRRQEGALERFEARLAWLDGELERRPYLGGREYGFADIGYVPWVVRTPSVVGVGLGGYPAIEDWIARLAERPAIAAELDVVSALA